MRPSTYTLLPTLPTSENGKVDRRALLQLAHRAKDAARSSTGESASGTDEGSLEARVITIWRSISRRPVRQTDKLSELGGTSLALSANSAGSEQGFRGITHGQ